MLDVRGGLQGAFPDRCGHCGASAVVTREEVSPSETGRRCLLCGREPGQEAREALRQRVLEQGDSYHTKDQGFHKFKHDPGPPGRKHHRRRVQEDFGA